MLPGTSAEMGESKQLLPGHIHVVTGTQCNLNLSEIGCLNCTGLSQAAQSGLQPSQSHQQVNVLQRVTVYKGHRAYTWRPSKELQQSLLGAPRPWQVLGDTRVGIKATEAGQAQGAHARGQAADSEAQGWMGAHRPHHGTCNGAATWSGERQSLVERPGEKPQKTPAHKSARADIQCDRHHCHQQHAQPGPPSEQRLARRAILGTRPAAITFHNFQMKPTTPCHPRKGETNQAN